MVRQDENKYHCSCDKQHGLSRYVLHRHDGGLHRHPAFKRNGGQLFGFQSAFAAGLSYKFVMVNVRAAVVFSRSTVCASRVT